MQIEKRSWNKFPDDPFFHWHPSFKALILLWKQNSLGIFSPFLVYLSSGTMKVFFRWSAKCVPRWASQQWVQSVNSFVRCWRWGGFRELRSVGGWNVWSENKSSIVFKVYMYWKYGLNHIFCSWPRKEPSGELPFPAIVEVEALYSLQFTEDHVTMYVLAPSKRQQGFSFQHSSPAMKDTNSMFTTLQDASTADLSQVLGDVKKYSSEVVTQETCPENQRSGKTLTAHPSFGGWLQFLDRFEGWKLFCWQNPAPLNSSDSKTKTERSRVKCRPWWIGRSRAFPRMSMSASKSSRCVNWCRWWCHHPNKNDFWSFLTVKTK